MQLTSNEPNGADLDGDGKVSPWEQNLCRVCLMAAVILAFGDEAVGMLL